MIEAMHITDDPSRIGFYSGLIVCPTLISPKLEFASHATIKDSIAAIAQLLTVYHWGKLSDRMGRRPVLFMGLFGVALSSFTFGLSNSLVAAIIARTFCERYLHLYVSNIYYNLPILAGLLTGNIACFSNLYCYRDLLS